MVETQKWFYGESMEIKDKNENNEKENEIKNELFRIKPTKIDHITFNCEYNKNENKKVITILKETIAFKNLTNIYIQSNFIQLRTSVFNNRFSIFGSYPFSGNEEKFHKILDKTFDEYCELEYKNNFSKADEIRKFKKLLDENAITEEEYELFKKDLLNKN